MKRTILLVDMNAFYISCEASRNPELKSIPAAVAGLPKKRAGIILAANYAARKFGVKSAMTALQAQKLCPQIRLVKPDHEFYKAKSQEMHSLLLEFSPVVEANSIDEAWLDLSGCSNIYKTPYQAAVLIRQEIRDRLDLPCSIGISSNKFLAKTAADFKKPMGITELWPQNIEKSLWPLSVNKMHGVGPKTATKLLSLGIKTIGALAKTEPSLLRAFLGKNGEALHKYANGFDDEAVIASSQDDIKSIGKATTLSSDIDDPKTIKTILAKLADEVAFRARKRHKVGNTVRLTLKYYDFSQITRQRTLEPTNLASDIIKAANQLLAENLVKGKAVRLVGVTLAGFEISQSRQLSLFELDLENNKENAGVISTGISETSKSKNKQTILEETLDQIKEKHGHEIIRRASQLKDHEF